VHLLGEEGGNAGTEEALGSVLKKKKNKKKKKAKKKKEKIGRGSNQSIRPAASHP